MRQKSLYSLINKDEKKGEDVDIIILDILLARDIRSWT